MKSHRFYAIILCLALCGQIVRAQDMDTAISNLTEDLAAKAQQKGCKRITVIDFTDGNKRPTTLGKYIADQITVGLVMTNRDFSVLDREHLKRIMDEHKLTVSGLVDPENAKKLGQFAGVDAMIFGKAVPLAGTVNVAATLESTETGIDVGGARRKFKVDEAVQQLIAEPVNTEDAATAGDAPKPAAPKPKPFGDLDITVDSFRLDPAAQGFSYSGAIYYSLIITNRSATDIYGVAMKAEYSGRSWGDLTIMNSRNETFRVEKTEGIDSVTELQGGGFLGNFTEMQPSSSIVVTGKSVISWNGKPGDYRPYRLQVMMYFGVETQGRMQEVKKRNLVLDIK